MNPILRFSQTAFFLLMVSFTSQAALQVIEDRGGTPAAPYYESLNPQLSLDADGMQLPSRPAKRYTEAEMLPVRSPSLSPGKVESRTINAPGLVPVFLIGDDPISRRWLAVRGEILRKLNAVGLVVNVETASELAGLRKAASELQLSPASGEDLANRLHLEHYPVLLTPTSMEQ